MCDGHVFRGRTSRPVCTTVLPGPANTIKQTRHRATLAQTAIDAAPVRESTDMRILPWRHIYAWLLAAFFVLGGSLNTFASPEILADYQRWGYPDWFHYLTGLTEWTAAALIALPATRLAGSVLACAVMAAAAGTVLLNGEYAHAVPPLVVLALAGLNGWLTWRAGRRSAAAAA